jgi:regulator of sigma E protease
MILYTVLGFLFVLTVVVFFHELGHFLVARWCGVAVKTFSIGFGPEIAGFNDRHGTRWSLSSIPLGGYVQFVDDENAASARHKSLEELTPEERKGSFQTKPLAARAAIVAAGPIANFVLAIVIFAAIYTIFGVRPAKVESVSPGSAAEQAGFKPGDFVISIDGQKIDSFNEMQRVVAVNAEQPLQIVVDRGGENVEFTATPERKKVTDDFGNSMVQGFLFPELQARVGSVEPGSPAERAGFVPEDVVITIDGQKIDGFSDMQGIVANSPDRQLHFVVDRNGKTIDITATPKRNDKGQVLIGIAAAFPKDRTLKPVNPLTALRLAVKECYFIVSQSLAYLWRVVTLKESADQLGGPIRIAQVSGQVASVSFVALVSLAAVLSVSIGLLNLFPIPMLDGGHLLYYSIEAIRGRPLSETTQEIGFRIGLALILMLMIFATWNDLIQNKFL